MSWDIYGEPLRFGHCEVHPHVHEEYPCSVCIADKQSSEQQGGCRGYCESEHLLSLQREHIEHLTQERDELRKLAYIGEHLHEDCSWKFRFSELKAERDALAAHVERLRTAWRQYEDSEYCSEDEIKAEEQLYALMEEDPATSLARLKAQWQADAVSTFAFHHLGGHEQEVAEIYASRLRQQAEGGEV